MSTLSVGTIKSASSAAPVIQNSSGTEKGQFAKAWINFDGAGTIATRDSFNVSSITDNGTGDYTISFSTSMANTNYCVTGNCTYLMGTVPRFRILSGYVWATGSIRVITGYTDTSGADHEVVGVAIFGD
jgi:hypothetical protein